MQTPFSVLVGKKKQENAPMQKRQCWQKKQQSAKGLKWKRRNSFKKHRRLKRAGVELSLAFIPSQW